MHVSKQSAQKGPVRTYTATKRTWCRRCKAKIPSGIDYTWRANGAHTHRGECPKEATDG